MDAPIFDKEHMSYWPDEVRGAPNAILRSSLFSVSLPPSVPNGDGGFSRPFLSRRLRSASNGIIIIYSGEPLDWHDFYVWLELIHQSRYQAGPSMEFGMVATSARSLLTELGRNGSGANCKLLFESIRRLHSGTVEINAGQYCYSGRLLDEVEPDEVTKRYRITINPDLKNLFGTNGWTGLNVEQLIKLRKKRLAKWLFCFYSSHKNTDKYLYKAITIQSICGSVNEDLFGFRRDLKKALTDLSAATGWECWIDKHNNVRVKKNAA